MNASHIFPAIIMTIISVSATGQNKQHLAQQTIKVWGNCQMCKARIEKAAKGAGAASAVWNVDSKILSVSYAPGNTSFQKIEKSLSAAGHDTTKENASDEAYNELPECCQYERKPVGEVAERN
jgi:mercuric ion binding protein